MPLALAALPEIIFAFVALILVYALYQLLAPVLRSMAEHVPYIGNAMATAVDSILGSAIAASMSWAQGALGHVVGFILAPVYWLEHIISYVLQMADDLRGVVAYVVRSLLEQYYQAAIAVARAAIAQAIGQVEAYMAEEWAEVQSEFHTVYTTLGTDIEEVDKYAAALFTAAERYTASAIAAETTFVEQSVAALESEISAVDTSLTTYIGAEYTSAIRYTQSVEAALGAEISNVDTALTKWVGENVTSLTGYITAVGAAAAAYTQAAVGAVAAELDDLEKNCTDDLCSGLGGLASLFNSLVDTGAIAALAAYAAWMALDPRGAGGATADVVAPIATGAADGARDLIGAL